MRILMPTSEFPPAPGGVSAVAWEQANGLAKLGHEVVVETLDFSQYGAPPTPEADIDIRYRLIRAKAIKRVLPLSIHNRKTAKAFRPDVVLCPQYRGTGIPAMLAAGQAKCPLILYLHSNEIRTELSNPLRLFCVNKVLRSATRLMTNTHNTKRLVSEWVPKLDKANMIVVHPGIHLHRLQSPTAQTEGLQLRKEWLQKLGVKSDCSPIVLGSLSRVSLQKGIDVTIKSIASISRTHPNLPIVYIVGGVGPDAEQCQEMVREHNLVNRVLFIGPINYPNNTAFFNAIDVFVQPSQPYKVFIESFGISPLEAQACGKPVISTDWGGIPEAVVRDKSGILVPVKNQQAVEDAILKLAVDTELRTRMGQAGIEHAKQFSWEKHAKQVEEVLLSLVPKSA
ncbi:MAG: glycosyltransferase family 4 protein [Candidatus Sumerlaeales bacterium]|nr:glycosyltransferase family 4 protein [Candidatus Sumerlaeales bacterium]